MKIRMFLIGLILISGITAYSQDSKDTKAKIKPALLVIDIQNAYLDGMQGKEQAMMNINYYIQYSGRMVSPLSGYIITTKILDRNRGRSPSSILHLCL
jgi:hypothetical protein